MLAALLSKRARPSHSVGPYCSDAWILLPMSLKPLTCKFTFSPFIDFLYAYAWMISLICLAVVCSCSVCLRSLCRVSSSSVLSLFCFSQCCFALLCSVCILCLIFTTLCPLLSPQFPSNHEMLVPQPKVEEEKKKKRKNNKKNK